MSAEYFIFSLTIYNKMARYTGSKGKIYEFGDNEKIAAGGEGIVYHIIGDSSHVAKIYKTDHFKTSSERNTTKRKLEAMLKFNIKPICNNKLRLAWPEDILYDNGEMVGFVMPSVTSTTKIYQICRNGKERLRLYPNYSWKHALQFSYLLAWVVAYVHANGIVIGDMNQNNIIMDTKNDTVILIDCDSFDITDPVTKEHFPCTVGFPEMLAPEIQDKLQSSGKMNQAPFSRESDNFSLAIHIFRLLMNNQYPFGGVNRTATGSSVSLNNIGVDPDVINGESPYVRSCKYKIRDESPSLSMLPQSLQELFKRTFTYTAVTVRTNIKKRATADEWTKALLPLAGAKVGGSELSECKSNTLSFYKHIYPAHNASCPWCEIYARPPIPTPKPIKNTIVPTAYTGSNTSTGSNKQTATTTTYTNYSSGNNNVYGKSVRRSPALLYIAMIIIGLASGFLLNNLIGDIGNKITPFKLNNDIYGIVMAVIGVIGAVIIAHIAEDSYIHANNGIPYLFLGIFVLIIPPIVVLLLGLVVTLVLAVVYIIIELLAVVFVIFCICSACSGS